VATVSVSQIWEKDAAPAKQTVGNATTTVETVTVKPFWEKLPPTAHKTVTFVETGFASP
jgi:hypothetical protein